MCNYSSIPNLPWNESHAGWMHGSIRFDDAYKGRGSTSDQQSWHDTEVLPLWEKIVTDLEEAVISFFPT